MNRRAKVIAAIILVSGSCELLSTAARAEGVGSDRKDAVNHIADTRAPLSGKGNTKKCWLIECTGTTGTCYAYGDVGSNIYYVEPGKMSRHLVDCPTGAHGSRRTKAFAFDPADPTLQTGFGWTYCEAWVDGATASVTEFDETQTQTNFNDWLNAQ